MKIISNDDFDKAQERKEPIRNDIVSYINNNMIDNIFENTLTDEQIKDVQEYISKYDTLETDDLISIFSALCLNYMFENKLRVINVKTYFFHQLGVDFFDDKYLRATSRLNLMLDIFAEQELEITIDKAVKNYLIANKVLTTDYEDIMCELSDIYATL